MVKKIVVKYRLEILLFVFYSVAAFVIIEFAVSN